MYPLFVRENSIRRARMRNALLSPRESRVATTVVGDNIILADQGHFLDHGVASSAVASTRGETVACSCGGGRFSVTFERSIDFGL